MESFFIQVARMTVIQIITICGVFFVFSFLLSKVQAAILKNYSRSVGWRGVLWTAWLGTPVHEYSHALVALLFKHKINDVVLFSPDANTGELGHVNHSYNPKSLYQSIGNFFIGLAPLIIGPLVLVILLYALIPQGRELFNQLPSNYNLFTSLSEGIIKFLQSLFSPANLASYRFWIFLYFSFCLASHLAPSKSDLKGAWRGGIVIIFWLFIINIFALLINRDITVYILKASNFLTGLIKVYIYVLLISLIHFLLSFIILWPWRKRRN
jgi:hypothetical protein